MKKNILLLVMAVLTLSAAATDRFYIEDFTIAAGETRTVEILLDNTTTYTAFQCDLNIPEGLTVNEASFALTSRKVNHSLSVKANPNGNFRLLSYSLNIKPYSGNSGALVTFDVTASADFEDDVTILVRNIFFTTTEAVEVPFNNEECQVSPSVTNSIGDVNDNGAVDINDITILIDYVLGKDVSSINLENSDLNFDGNIDISDITLLIDVVLGNIVITPPDPNVEEIIVNGVTFNMVHVKGGTFMMGATPEQGENVRENEKPVHQVTVSSFNIGQTEVTQELWLAVMGTNPSYHTGDLQRPVEKVSWVDCQAFIAKLNELTGRVFRLPTEAEWEFAARGGKKSKGYKFSGSNTAGDVAWYTVNSENSTHPVATKAPNELGIYDMTGNVWEWCYDWYKKYTEDAQVDPVGPETGNNRVLRGGCWNGSGNYGRISYRDNFTPTGKNYSGGLRLVLDDNETITVNGVTFTMMRVHGGTFTMGCTVEQDTLAQEHEAPLHQVTVSTYYMSETEVTQELWQAVMGTNPSGHKGDPQYPVETVSYDKCQEFITELNALTGKTFRMPTEAEWEFAARGGINGRGYYFAGSDDLDKIAWFSANSGGKTQPVATKQPNELGIYDLCGNVFEWCHDWYSLYTEDPQVNPSGPETGLSHIYRGGGMTSSLKACRITRRNYFAPVVARNNLGLRLAM